jgi:hypothetical protein
MGCYMLIGLVEVGTLVGKGVARERRRGDRPPTKYKCKFNGGIYI